MKLSLVLVGTLLAAASAHSLDGMKQTVANKLREKGEATLRMTQRERMHQEALAAGLSEEHWGYLGDALTRGYQGVTSIIGTGWSCVKGLFEDSASAECLDSLRRLNIGQLPVGATGDLLQFKLGTGYTEGWCGSENLPSGWRPRPSGNGFTGCDRTENFPGQDATSFNSHAYVKEEMKKLPGLQNSGQVWRGNELGFIVSNEIFWPKVSPRSVLLGASVDQHKAVRPVLDDVYGHCDNACYNALLADARSAQSGDSLTVQNDIKKWVFRYLWKRTFPGVSNPINEQEFVDVQTKFTTYSTITQLLPDWLGNLISKSTIENMGRYYNIMLPHVGSIYGNKPSIAKGNCGGSQNGCVGQLTSAFLDTLLGAGGLSVPGGISTGLWALYGPTGSYNQFFESSYTLDNKKATEFFYESIRFFAPVVGFPWWTTRPARATNDTASQTAGGHRKILNLAMSSKDPNAWGSDAHKFRVRSLSEYHNNYLGFADLAYDNNVADGAMNRVCPGKTLALQMGKAWFTAWNQGAWCTSDRPEYAEATPFAKTEFTLRKKSKTCGNCVLNGKSGGSSCSNDSECCSGSCNYRNPLHNCGWRGCDTRSVKGCA